MNDDLLDPKFSFYLLQVVRQLVDLQDEELEWVFGGSGWIQEQPKLLLGHGRPAREHLERLGDTAEDPNDGSDQLTSREVLAGMQNVRGLLGHRPREGAYHAALFQRTRGQLGILEESGQEGPNLVHGSDGRIHLYPEQVGLGPDQIL